MPRDFRAAKVPTAERPEARHFQDAMKLLRQRGALLERVLQDVAGNGYVIGVVGSLQIWHAFDWTTRPRLALKPSVSAGMSMRA